MHLTSLTTHNVIPTHLCPPCDCPHLRFDLTVDHCAWYKCLYCIYCIIISYHIVELKRQNRLKVVPYITCILVSTNHSDLRFHASEHYQTLKWLVYNNILLRKDTDHDRSDVGWTACQMVGCSSGVLSNQWVQWSPWQRRLLHEHWHAISRQLYHAHISNFIELDYIS